MKRRLPRKKKKISKKDINELFKYHIHTPDLIHFKKDYIKKMAYKCPPLRSIDT